MQLIDKIIRRLNSGDWLSAEKLSADLAISERQVAALIQQLLEQGLVLERTEHRYRLAPDMHLLDAEEIAGSLISTIPLDSFAVLQSVGSTNSHLLDQQIDVGRMRVCLSESQSGGRGRRGNSWQSAPFRNLMMSLSWGFAQWPKDIGALSLAVGLCVAQELNQRYAVDAKIKWPNDILIGTDKLAGILIDVAGQASGECKVVIGLGLNVAQPDWSQPESSDYHWQDLAGLGIHANRNSLAAALLNRFVIMLQDFTETGFAPLVDQWNALSAFDNRVVKVGSGNESIIGRMSGVDSSGAVLLQTRDGHCHRVTDSTVSLRLADIDARQEFVK